MVGPFTFGYGLIQTGAGNPRNPTFVLVRNSPGLRTSPEPRGPVFIYPHEVPDAGEDSVREAHGAFQLMVFLQDIPQPLASPEVLPAHETLQPGPMAEHRHGKVAAVQHARDERLLEAFGDMAAADRNVKSAGVAVEVWKLPKHVRKHVEVLGIG